MSNKTFKTVTFGGFDKKDVQAYITEQMNSFKKEVSEKDAIISNCHQEIEKHEQLISELKTQLVQSEKTLEESELSIHQLKNTILLKEDKIASLEEQITKMSEQFKTMQAQTKKMIEESNQQTALKMKQIEEEANAKVESARLNAIALFDKINQDYQVKRKNYADMVKAMNQLSLAIQKADEEASTQLTSLPESLLR